MSSKNEAVMRYVSRLVVFCWLCLAIEPALAVERSRSLVLTPDETRIISANFDAGSVSLLERSTGKLLVERKLGKDIRRLAVAEEGSQPRLLVSDYADHNLILLSLDTLKEIKRIPVPARPFGVVYDQVSKRFYATSFEQARLLVLSLDGELLFDIETSPSPRGLLLTDDRRLLVSHSLSGELSFYDVKGEQPVLKHVLQLADSPLQEPATVPQGKPRLLDNMGLSPDGQTLWLPHVLWSFSRDFQFQSSVFPAVSLVDLSTETELTDERKLLFEQINITEPDGSTRIVSNPHDVEFIHGGDKVVVSLAGSEDLMVFDLSRAAGASKSNRSKRHQRKKFQGGAKVTQIYRHVPGDNPRGIIAIDQDLFVQNAMSLDLVRFHLGAPGPFSRITVADEKFASLVEKDPVPETLRLGKTLFHRANTDDDPDHPMAGDFWMSCSSCHVDGFNFTNRTLMQDATKNRFENATTGHVSIPGMFAGNPIAASIDLIQKTQGGMSGIDPMNPDKEITRKMMALLDYIRQPDNLPYVSTWLRLDAKEPYTHPAEWLNSAECAECHSTIYKQWADSNHGMHMDHPFYRFQEDVAAASEGEDFRAFCRGCHAPQSVFNNDLTAFADYGDMLEKAGISLEQARQNGMSVNERGTGCVLCHRITKLENAGGNADFTVNLKDRDAYLLENSSLNSLKWFANRQINAAPAQHKASYSNPALYQDSLYCASCHNEFSPAIGANINDNYGEWLASAFNQPDKPEQHKTCIDCHMNTDVTNFNLDQAGQSTLKGPEKAHVRSHHFTGGNYYLSGLRNKEHQKLSETMLKTALSMKVEHRPAELVVSVTNERAGHHMPGGSRRQVWIEIEIVDRDGRPVYSHGLMQNGEVPKDARRFIKKTVDEQGKPVGLHFWRYTKVAEDTRIASGETRQEHFTLPANMVYPIKVSTRIRYQTFSKKLVDQVRAAFPEQAIPYPEVVDMVTDVQWFDAP